MEAAYLICETRFLQPYLIRNTLCSFPSLVWIYSELTITSYKVRQSISVMQGVGMMGSLGSSSSLRPSGVTASHPHRPFQSSLKPQTCGNNQSSAAQLNRIISKRSIQEIVAQVTTFVCSLAKHRKSDTLESKDIFLHLERNWNMSLGGDEIKCYKKPLWSLERVFLGWNHYPSIYLVANNSESESKFTFRKSY